MLRFSVLFLSFVLGVTFSLFAQEAAPKTSLPDSLLQEVVVSATRSERLENEITTPILQIQRAQIQQMGAARLGDVLREIGGIVLTHNHGQGIQLQGLDPEYTLILIDGEPLIGRTAGTLDLSRISIGNIERIEVLKGPASSLYGSEALGGVINIITKKAKKNTSSLNLRYGNSAILDAGLQASLRGENHGLQIFLNHFQNGGYDFDPEVYGQTASPFQNQTVQLRADGKLGTQTDYTFSGKFFNERQDYRYEVSDAARVRGVGKVRELSFHPSMSRRFGERLRLHARLYFTQYRAENDDRFTSDESVFDATFFEQQFLRPEVQAEYFAGENHIFTLGGGRSNESVSATRYTEKQYFANTYLYFLHEWTVSEKLSLHSGGRLDAHSVYGTRFSPKLAGRYDFNDKISLKLNVAAGFKAPDFRQLYLNFTNNSIGYSVFGTHEAAARLNELEAQGLVSERLQAPTENLQAEHSIAFNAELAYQVTKKLNLKASVFHNEVFQKIETFALARKTNAQFVFSYANLGQIYTQGADLNANYDLTKHFRLIGNYQLLYAKDRDVLAGLERGEYFTRNPETLQTRRLTRRDYKGLFNRSRHTLSLGLYFQYKKLNASLRGIYRSKFGLADRNGNLILDDEREFARGFLLLNASVSRSLWKECLQLQGGVENVLNYTDPVGQPGLPGRLYFLKINATLF